MSPQFPRYDWDESNIRHISRHGVTVEEIVWAFQDPYAVLSGHEVRHNELRYRMVGETHDGRVLAITFITRDSKIRVVTAYSAKGRSLVEYKRRRSHE